VYFPETNPLEIRKEEINASHATTVTLSPLSALVNSTEF
jgi:hypothetical protein